MKRKELPVYLLKEIKSPMPLCVILTEENLKPWYYENFINFSYIIGWNFKYAGLAHEFLGICGNICHHKSFDYSDIPKENIVEKLKAGIDEGYYAHIYMDEYYLSPKAAYKKYNFEHDSLIYGYDDETETFLSIAFNENMIFSKLQYRYEEVRSGFCPITVADPPKLYSLTLFKLKNFNFPYRFSLKRFSEGLYNYIYSIDLEDENYMSSFYKWQFNLDSSWGVSATHAYISSLKTDKYSLTVANIYFLYEHKKSLLERFKWIQEKYDLLFGFELLINDFSLLTDEYDAIKMLAVKMELTGSDIIKEKIITKLEDLIKKEKELLIKVYSVLRTARVKEMGLVRPNLELTADNIDAEYHEINENGMNAVSFKYNWNTPQLIGKITIPVFEHITIFINGIFLEDYYALPNEALVNFDFKIPEKYIQEIELRIENQVKTHITPNDIKIESQNLLFKADMRASSVWLMDDGQFNPDNTPERVIDLSPNTFWSSKFNSGAGEYWEAAFETATAVNCVLLLQRLDIDRIAGYKIQYRLKDDEWKDIVVFEGKLMGNEWVRHDFETVYTDEIRLLITDTKYDQYGYNEPGINQIQIYGLK